jgi:hypothetical protein
MSEKVFGCSCGIPFDSDGVCGPGSFKAAFYRGKPEESGT